MAEQVSSPLLRTYLGDRCTFHGFPRTRSCSGQGSIYRRFVWFIIFILFTMFGSWQLYAACLDYARFPTITSLDVKQPKDLEFPSVTICPLLPFNEDLLVGEQYKDMYPELHALPVIAMFLKGHFHDLDAEKTCLKSESYALYVTVCCPKTTRHFVKVLNESLHLNVTQKLYQNFCAYSTIISSRSPLFNMDVGLKSMLIELGFKADAGTNTTSENIRRDNIYMRLANWSLENLVTALETDWSYRGNYLQGLSMKDLPSTNLPFSKFLEAFKFDSVADTNSEINRAAVGLFESEGIPISAFFDPDQHQDTFAPLIRASLKTTGNSTAIDVENIWSALGAYQFLKHPLAVPINQIYQKCIFNNNHCENQLYASVDPKWKTCIHFNNEYFHLSNADDNDIFKIRNNRVREKALTTNSIGKSGGLTLQLNYPKSEVLGAIAKFAGFAVAVGDSSTVPRLDKFFTVRGKGNTDLVIRRKEINRLAPENWGNCGKEDHFKTVFPDKEIVGSYNQEICASFAKAFFVLDRCRCVTNNDILSGIIGIKQLILQYDTCSDTEEEECVTNATTSVDLKGCIPACREVMFEVEPTIFSATDAKPEVATNTIPAKSDGITSKFNLNKYDIEINIFYQSRSTEVYIENPVYTTISFIANLGGLAGLYIGMSMLSIVEIGELICDLVTTPCLKFLKKKTLKADVKKSQCDE